MIKIVLFVQGIIWHFCIVSKPKPSRCYEQNFATDCLYPFPVHPNDGPTYLML